MDTTHQKLLVICGIGISLVGYAGYLLGHSASGLPDAGFSSIPALTILSTPQRAAEGNAENSGEQKTTWRAVRSDLFTRVFPSSPPPLFFSLPVAASHAPLPLTTLLAPPFLPDPLAAYVYTGSVTSDGVRFALIENEGNRQGWYVQAGDLWQGYRVVAVTEQAVTILAKGKKYLMPRSGVINLVPLLADGNKGGPSPDGNGSLLSAQAGTQQNDLLAGQSLNAGLSFMDNFSWEMPLPAPNMQPIIMAKGPDEGGQNSITVSLSNDVSEGLGLSFSAAQLSVEVPANPAPIDPEPARQPSEPMPNQPPNE